MHIAAHGSARVPESSSVRPAAGGAALACLVAGTLLATGTACSSGSGGGSEALTALSHLRADVHASKQVTYVDEARIRKMSTSDPKRFRSVETPGSALLNQYEAGPWGTSLKVSQIGTAVDSSLGGHWDGTFDAAAVTASLKAHGFTPTEQDGKQVWKRPGGVGAVVRDRRGRDQVRHGRSGGHPRRPRRRCLTGRQEGVPAGGGLPR